MRALDFIRDMYGNNPSFRIIVLTDAEFTNTSSLQGGSFSPKNMLLIGVGTELGGYMIQSYNAEGMPLYREFQGSRVSSRLDQAAIEKMVSIFSAQRAYIDHEEDILVLQKSINHHDHQMS